LPALTLRAGLQAGAIHDNRADDYQTAAPGSAAGSAATIICRVAGGTSAVISGAGLIAPYRNFQRAIPYLEMDLDRHTFLSLFLCLARSQ
jgi:hypothetical protein